VSIFTHILSSKENIVIEDIIFDLYLTMKFKGYNKLTINCPDKVDLSEMPLKDIPLPQRAKTKLSNRMSTVNEVIELMLDNKRLNRVTGLGVNTIADIKNSILVWYINYNLENDRPALKGVHLSRV